MSLDRSTGNLVWQGQVGWYSLYPHVVASSSGKMFGRSSGVSPSDIISLELKADGSITSPKDSPYHGDYPHADAVFLFPNGTRVLDSAGVVYNGADLTYSGSFGGPVNDVAFHGADVPIVARGTNIIAYSNLLLETGRTSIPREAARIFLSGGTILAFLPANNDDHGLSVEVIPLSSLNPALPGEAPKLHGLPFTPDDVFVDKNSVVHLFSKQHQTIFRWSAATRQELPGIPLLGGPSYVAYSAPNHAIYLGYQEGQITQINLNESMREEGFVNLAEHIRGLETAGEYVFAVDESGAWVSHSTYTPDGIRVTWKDWNYYSRDFTWSPLNRRMYFFRDDTSPNDLHSEEINLDGSIGTQRETPYHGEVSTIHPIRVSPDARVVLLGSGQIYDATTLVRTNSLANAITDAAWRGTVLYTVREIANVAQVQRWSGTYAQTGVVQFEGKPLRVLSVPEGLLFITLEQDQPRIRLLGDNLATLYEREINLAPTSVYLTPSFVMENAPAGSVVGELAALDPNAADTHRFELLANSTALFELSTNKLVLKAPLDFEQTPLVNLSVRVTDPYGLALTAQVPVEVRGTNEPPDNITLSTNAVSENLAVGSLVATVHVSDPEGPQGIVLALLDNAGGRFVLTNDQLRLSAPLGYAQAKNHEIRIRATDPAGLSLEKTLVLEVREFIPPPPTGLVVLAFERQAHTNNIPIGTNWNESGFSVSTAPGSFSVRGSASPGADPSNGTDALNYGTNQFVLRHRSGLPFKVVSIDLAEANPNQQERTAIFRAQRPGRPEATFFSQLDGVGDGSSALRDFQTIYLPDTFENVSSLTIAGAPAVIDNIAVIVGATNQTYLWLRPIRIHAWESDASAQEPPYAHTGLFSVERFGPTNGSLQCKLDLSGSAGFLRDFFVSGLALDNTVTFVPGQKSVLLELVPIADSVLEPVETAEVTIVPGGSVTNVLFGGTLQTYVHSSAMEAWFASENPLQEPGVLMPVDPNADPDGNGLNNMAEFVMGIRAGDRAEARPSYSFTETASGLHVTCHITRNTLADGWTYMLEESADLRNWTKVTAPPSTQFLSSNLAQLSYSFELPRKSGVFIRMNIVAGNP